MNKNLVSGLTLALSSFALANDAGLTYGGSPSLLKGHKTIQMVSEIIRVDVWKDHEIVDCQFVFKNHGKATKARMGFPDRSSGAGNPEEEGRVDPPKGSFNWFNSWVDGKKVKTTIARGKELGDYWHVKYVPFADGQSVKVHDRYRVDTGFAMTPDNGNVREATYVVHTGASWKGKIGRSDVYVTFHGLKAPLHVMPLLDFSPREGDDEVRGASLHAGRFASSDIVWSGPSKPSVHGTRLHFVRKNWRPQVGDDVDLFFSYYKKK